MIKTKSCSEDTFVLLSVGSNVGDRHRNIELAFELLVEKQILTNAVMSSYYETEPVGILDQDWFLNVAIAGSTKLCSDDLLLACKEIELQIGREKRKRWHKREIDIDIILFGNEVVNTEELQIPHPRLYKRRFVLLPANEIAAKSRVPTFDMTIEELLSECNDTSKVTIYG